MIAVSELCSILSPTLAVFKEFVGGCWARNGGKGGLRLSSASNGIL